MNKAILIPIKPIWCAKIMNGDKTIEVRKNKALYKATIKLIKKQGYATFYMYCTKDKLGLFKNSPSIYKLTKEQYDIVDDVKHNNGMFEILNGKVVAKFTVRKAEEIECAIDYDHEDGRSCTYHTDSICQEILGECSCLYDDIDEYLDWKPDNIVGHAYRIEDLVIFDEPKELSEFQKPRTFVEKVWGIPYKLTKAPQNFCYVESEE